MKERKKQGKKESVKRAMRVAFRRLFSDVCAAATAEVEWNGCQSQKSSV